ncbi:MAG TPA: hypothetical protein VJZ01_04240 [Lachnospiraceae bacterium]|nr:hypothetical protein [Lachnospiraceae bacterium]
MILVKDCYCNVLGVIGGLIFAVAAGIIFSGGGLVGINVALWIILGLAVLTLLILVYCLVEASDIRCSALKEYLCVLGTPILIGTLGTITTSLIALSITLTPAVISSVILVAIAAFFFAFMLIVLFCFLGFVGRAACPRSNP